MQEASKQHCSVQFLGFMVYHNTNEGVVYRGIISKFMPAGSLDDVLHEHEVC